MNNLNDMREEILNVLEENKKAVNDLSVSDLSQIQAKRDEDKSDERPTRNSN